MTLDDLLRDTLATRAHDVDGIDLLAAVPAAPGLSRRGRAWAVTAVVAVAALVVGVLVATLGPGSERATPVVSAPADPPAGMQFVSYHGLTLTVPASWPVGPFSCTQPVTDAVVVDSVVAASCPAVSGERTPPAGLTRVQLTTATVLGDHADTTVAGRPAGRSVESDPTYPDQVDVVIQFHEPPLAILVRATSEAAADTILATVRSTPVDPRGCVENIDGDTVTGNPVADRLVPGTPITAVVCQYEDPSYSQGDPQWLLGSRELSDTETSDLVQHLSDAPAFTPAPDDGTVSTSGGLPVRYVLRFADGSSRVIDVRLDRQDTVARDGERQVTLTDDDRSADPTGTWFPPGAFVN